MEIIKKELKTLKQFMATQRQINDFLKSIYTANQCVTVKECVETIHKIRIFLDKMEEENLPYYQDIPIRIKRRLKTLYKKKAKLSNH